MATTAKSTAVSTPAANWRNDSSSSAARRGREHRERDCENKKRDGEAAVEPDDVERGLDDTVRPQALHHVLIERAERGRDRRCAEHDRACHGQARGLTREPLEGDREPEREERQRRGQVARTGRCPAEQVR